MNKHQVAYSLGVVLLIFIFSIAIFSTAHAGQHIIEPKLGVVDWTDNNNQRIRNDTFNIDDNPTGSLGFMYLYRLDNGFSFGGEVFGYNRDYTRSDGRTGEVDTSHIYANAEYYFNNDKSVKPFVGFGLGSVGMEFTGVLKQETRGPSLQLKGGVEFDLSEKLAIAAEAKYFTVDIDEDVGGIAGKIESKGYALFVGLAIKL